MRRASTILLALVTTASCGTPAGAPAGATPVSVATVLAVDAPLAQFVEVGGVVQARTTATLSSRIVATVRAVPQRSGTRVRAGQPVVLLDARDLDADVRRARASVTAHEQSLRAAAADQAAAEAARTAAQAIYARILQLHGARAATPRELDDAVAAREGANARADAAAARVRAAEAALDVSREAAGAAQVGASFAVVAAPFDGIVAETLVEPGDLAAPGTSLARVEDVRVRRVEVALDESQVAVIDADAPVAVEFGPGDGEEAPVTGRIVEVARAADAGPHAFLIKVELPPSAAVPTGTFARVRFPQPPRLGLTIPGAALIEHGQLPTVFVVTDGRARMRVVRVGVAGALVEILAGVAAGEPVIVNPPPTLRDGDPVLTSSGGGGA